MNRITLILGTAILGLSLFSCTPVKKTVKALERGEEAIGAIIRHEGIRAITLNDWAVVFTVPLEEITPYLECHEQRHQVQMSWYDSPMEYRRDYLIMLASGALKAGADDGHYVGLVLALLDGPTMDELDALGGELRQMLRESYRTHPMEIDARGECAHLED